MTVATPILEIPDVPLLGPVTKVVKRRALLVYLGMVVLGWAIALLGSSFFAGFGLGLFFPGSGFIYTGQWLASIVTLVLFGVAFFIWFASGNILAPAGVWLIAAILSGASAAGADAAVLNEHAFWLIPVIMVLARGILYIRSGQVYKTHVATRDRRNEYLAGIPFEPASEPAYGSDYWGELSPAQLGALRFTFDRALQPVDEFGGFEWHEWQFQFAAVRYQLNYLNYGLHICQQRYTPNFHGYLNLAQRNLIEKALDKRVWGYWKWEALWGQLSTDFDPIKKENIMLSGWWGINVAAYTSNTGDQRYTLPGSLTFKYDDKEFPYDLPAIAQAVHRNHTESEWCLYACEPNWVYNMCNESGMTLLMMHDKQYGTEYFESLEKRFFDNIDMEYTTVEGRVIALRSQRMGFSIPLLTSPGADAQFALLGSPLNPLVAQRVWHIMRRDLMRLKPDGSIEIDTQGWDEVDGGNYKPSNITTYLNVRMVAQEMGDVEVADAIERTMKQQHEFIEGDVQYFAEGSVMANAMYTLGSLLNKNGWSDFVKHRLPEHIHEGPVLANCRYPDVLVAKAVSYDGVSLDLTLLPGIEDGPQMLTFERLRPGAAYNLQTPGGIVRHEADGQGQLACEVDLNGRSQLKLMPL